MKDYTVAGIALGEQEARDLVAFIIADLINEKWDKDAFKRKLEMGC